MNLQDLVALKDVRRITRVDLNSVRDGSVRQVSPHEIFEEYRSLDDLIKKNSLWGAREMTVEVVNALISAQSPHLARLDESLRRDFCARVVYDGKEIMDLEIRTRTNFDTTLVKRPSIVLLYFRGNPVLVLREARRYSKEQMHPLYTILNNPRAANNYAKMHLDENHLNILPEPWLLCALEACYGKGLPALTLPTKHVAESDTTLHYIRPFIGTAWRDEALTAEEAGQYIGWVHSYGLMERLDRVPEQFVKGPDNTGTARVYTIDPDFFLWSLKKSHLQTDLEDFFDMIKKMHRTIDTKAMRTIRDVRAETMRRYPGAAEALRDELRQWYKVV